MRVQMLRLMANPKYGTVQAGEAVDLPADEARRRIAAGDCKPLDSEPRRRAAPPAAPDDGGAGGEPVAVEKMTVDQLKAYAAEQDIDLGDATKKDDIRALVVAELERRRDADDD
ncbi:hypothetical protein CG717_16210 [Streptomyces sp. CB02613]|uniref:hypothetical protein n=1 Tax=Streptomyces sp. CB02613 TaxID=2020328 RepID=UPI000C27944A|nr:hypothetical protein [Streptomyces sp. CB02613]PJN31310.1 hypothetical protein CG717_16210 [Streptomyces sp. CB02613]